MTDLSATAPPWLRQAMARPYETQEARVDGLTLEVRSWGRLGAPGLRPRNDRPSPALDWPVA